MTGRWWRALRIPLILLAVNLVGGVIAAGVVYGYAGSQASLRDRLAAAIHSLNHERATVDEDLAYIEANQAEYEALLARGLAAEQDRLAAARLLEQLRDRHRLLTVRYSFSPQRAAPLGQGRLAQMTLLTTEVTIDITGVTDLDLLAFVSAVTDGLSGDVRVVGLSLQRRFDAAPGVLALLRARERVDMVEGRLQLEWRALRWRDDRAAAPASS
jgi:hypothetical protein